MRLDKFGGLCRGRRLYAVFSSSMLLALLLSCSPPVPTPIQSRQPPPSLRINIHEVQSGETLYSIAWRYETDFRDMAEINGLREPYRLAPGQQLKIRDDRPPGEPSVAILERSTQAPEPEKTSVREQTDIRSTPRNSDAKTAEITSVGGSANPPVFERSMAATASSTTSKTKVVAQNSFIDHWVWPSAGRVVKSFGTDSRTKGISIDPEGEKSVYAAAAGTVVYAGTGIRGVGNLIILKHSNLYLSAYAHNDRLVVKEGDTVKIGQKIAFAGRDASGKPRVYFEIREDGRPVDPIRFLPKR